MKPSTVENWRFAGELDLDLFLWLVVSDAPLSLLTACCVDLRFCKGELGPVILFLKVLVGDSVLPKFIFERFLWKVGDLCISDSYSSFIDSISLRRFLL